MLGRWTLPHLVDTKISGEYNTRGEKYGKQDKERRVYTKDFKAAAAALAQKREKPVSQIARDLGINGSQL